MQLQVRCWQRRWSSVGVDFVSATGTQCLGGLIGCRCIGCCNEMFRTAFSYLMPCLLVKVLFAVVLPTLR